MSVRIGVRREGGRPPGYEWNVGIIDFVFEEAIKLLGESAYRQLSSFVRELAMQDDPTHSNTLDLKPIENYMELRDSGYPYGGANIRLFYGVDAARRTIVPLGVIKKQNNGPTPQPDKIRMRSRWRRYLSGDFGFLPESL